MKKFTETEIRFLTKMEECRVATCHNDIPHVKPVSYIFEKNEFYIATDYETRMYKNIFTNPQVAISVDIYKLGNHQAICIQGKATIIDRGREFLETYKKFFEKFEWVRRDPWKELEAPFIKIIPNNKSSWGLD